MVKVEIELNVRDWDELDEFMEQLQGLLGDDMLLNWEVKEDASHKEKG